MNAVILCKFLANVFPTANYHVTSCGNVDISNIPGDNTTKYTFYFHDDGIRIRRLIDMWCGCRYYQLHRNSHTCDPDKYWPAFKSINEAVDWFEGYINRNANKH